MFRSLKRYFRNIEVLLVTLTLIGKKIMSDLDTINQSATRIADSLGKISNDVSGINVDIKNIAALLLSNPTPEQLANAAQTLTTTADGMDTAVEALDSAKAALDGLVPTAVDTPPTP